MQMHRVDEGGVVVDNNAHKQVRWFERTLAEGECERDEVASKDKLSRRRGKGEFRNAHQCLCKANLYPKWGGGISRAAQP